MLSTSRVAAGGGGVMAAKSSQLAAWSINIAKRSPEQLRDAK